MAIDGNIINTSSTWCRYYAVPPDQKTLEQCRSHGSDHQAYGWSAQIDPRWSADQKAAYIAGYERMIV